MESLMSLARELTFEEGTSLGQQLGVKPETIKKISQNVEKDHVSGNFQILCSWRGRYKLIIYESFSLKKRVLTASAKSIDSG